MKGVDNMKKIISLVTVFVLVVTVLVPMVPVRACFRLDFEENVHLGNINVEGRGEGNFGKLCRSNKKKGQINRYNVYIHIPVETQNITNYTVRIVDANENIIAEATNNQSSDIDFNTSEKFGVVIINNEPISRTFYGTATLDERRADLKCSSGASEIVFTVITPMLTAIAGGIF